jgi:Rap guanine nucleotide exchange factor 2
VAGGQPPSNAMVALNQLTVAGGTGGQQGAATVKRRKKSTAQPNPKKMFEEVLQYFLDCEHLLYCSLLL